MLAWISFKGCFDFAVRHSSQLSWFAFFLGWFPVLIAQGEIREKIRHATGWKRWLRRGELWFLFLIPVIAFISTKASEGTSDVADKKIDGLETTNRTVINRLSQTESNLTVATKQLVAIESRTRVRPFPERLLDFLNIVNPSIMQTLSTQEVRELHFSLMLPADQHGTLQELLREPGHENYIRPMPLGVDIQQTRLDGVFFGASLAVFTNVLEGLKRN